MEEYIILKSETFKRWLKKLTVSDRLRILTRFERIESGNFGDHKWFGDIGELRFFFGGGYRVYYTIKNKTVVFLLCAGDKSSQDNDFKKARRILQDVPDNPIEDED